MSRIPNHLVISTTEVWFLVGVTFTAIGVSNIADARYWQAATCTLGVFVSAAGVILDRIRTRRINELVMQVLAQDRLISTLTGKWKPPRGQ